jgi:hypothetical protein
MLICLGDVVLGISESLGGTVMDSQDGCEMLERCSDEIKLGEFSSIISWKVAIMGSKALHFG